MNRDRQREEREEEEEENIKQSQLSRKQLLP